MVERTESGEQRRVRFPNGADFAHEEEGTSCSCDEDEDEEECHDKNRPFLSKGCGLIPKFCLLNPIPGMKVSGQRLRPDSVRRVRGAGAEEEGLFCVWNPPGSGQRLSQNSVRKVGGAQVKKMEHGSLVKAEEEYSWEAIYKHKLLNGNTPAQEEDISKLAESNHHTYLSDSLTTDQSSPQYYSNTSAVTPYRNEPSQSPFHEGKGFLGIPRSPRRDNKGSRTDDYDSFEKDSENCWVMTPHYTGQSRSGSSSPAVERTLRVDTVHRPETSISKLSLQGTSLDDKDLIRSADNDSAIGVQTPGFGESLVLESHDEDALQSKITEIRLTVSPENSVCGAKEENSGLKPSDKDYIGILLKENNQVKNDADSMSSLLPPPLPNTPSESWLKRALPSVSSMKPSAKSFLDIHVQARKQVRISSLTVPKKDFHIKHPKVQRGQIRFADMLAEPLSPQAEI
ncbi:uncharacterized protein LOC109839880 [Asparagus officinalis]|nr:uncharacterized protein LOC109839880 [Asparagus officinalis]